MNSGQAKSSAKTYEEDDVGNAQSTGTIPTTTSQQPQQWQLPPQQYQPQQQWQQNPQQQQQWQQPNYQQQWPQQQQQQPYQTQPVIVYTQQPTVTIYQNPQPTLGKYGASFNGSAAVGIGSTLIILGFISYSAATAAIVFDARNYELYAGYWCGSFIIFAGSQSIHAGRYRGDSAIIGCLFTNLISCGFAWAQFGIGLEGVIYDIGYRWYDYYAAAITANATLLSAGGLAGILNITLFILCCISICCKSTVTPSNTTNVNVQPYGNTAEMQQLQVAYNGTSGQPMQPYPQANEYTVTNTTIRM